MLEFEILQELEPNAEILDIIKNYDYAIKNGRIRHLKIRAFILKNIIKSIT